MLILYSSLPVIDHHGYIKFCVPSKYIYFYVVVRSRNVKRMYDGKWFLLRKTGGWKPLACTLDCMFGDGRLERILE
jgi:hypothetical protein